MQFTWGLDGYGAAAGHVDARLQRFTRNMLDDLGGSRAHADSADLAAPSVSIDAPRRLQPVRIGRFGFALRGRASDRSGVRRVELALRHVPDGVRSSRCRFFDGRRGFRRRACEPPAFFRAKLRGTSWSFRLTRRSRLPRGTYFLRVRATDRAGNTNATFSREGRTLVRFRVR